MCIVGTLVRRELGQVAYQLVGMTVADYQIPDKRSATTWVTSLASYTNRLVSCLQRDMMRFR